MKKPRFLAEEAKEISQPQTEMIVGLGTGRDLEDEQMRRASVFIIVRFQFVFQHPNLDHGVGD